MRIFSGIQPTGEKHLGNYIGAIRQYVEGQDRADPAIYCIVDLHAITVPFDPVELRKRVYDTTAVLLASGLEPERCVLFRQSDVYEHTELSWLLASVCAHGDLNRMHQFKEKSARQRELVSAGLFFYPVLQAADILIYQPHGVPVGEDQRQHLELTRDLAQRFNSRFGETFVVPEALIVADTAKILDLADPNAKMSKSSPGGCVFLLDDERTITKKIKPAVTDSGRDIVFDRVDKPGVSNLLSLIAAFTGVSPEQAAADLQGRGYGDLKAAATDAVLSFTGPFAARVKELMDDPAELTRLMTRGAHRAREAAAPTLATVYDRVGFVSIDEG